MDFYPLSLATTLTLMSHAFTLSITPGPNNLMLLSSGATFGLRRTLPHMLGVSIGFVVMAITVGFGLGVLLDVFPQARRFVGYVGAAYLAYLAYRIAFARPDLSKKSAAKPLGFWAALAFQYVNPKAVGMAFSAMSLFAPDGGWTIVIVALVFGSVNFPSISTWAIVGARLGRFLAVGNRLRVFNLCMGLLLLASVWPMVKDL